MYEKPLKIVIKKTDRSAGESRSAMVEVCPSSLRSSDWIVYYYYIRFECNNCIRKKTILSGASVYLSKKKKSSNFHNFWHIIRVMYDRHCVKISSQKPQN